MNTTAPLRGSARIQVRWGDMILDRGYTSFPNVFLTHAAKLGIEWGDQAILLHILSFDNGRDHPYASWDTLAERLGRSRDYIRHRVYTLARRGLLRIIPTITKDGSGPSIIDLSSLVEKFRVLVAQEERPQVPLAVAAEGKVGCPQPTGLVARSHKVRTGTSLREKRAASNDASPLVELVRDAERLILATYEQRSQAVDWNFGRDRKQLRDHLGPILARGGDPLGDLRLVLEAFFGDARVRDKGFPLTFLWASFGAHLNVARRANGPRRLGKTEDDYQRELAEGMARYAH